MTRVIILKSRLIHFGGLERYALYLARAFHQKGCQVTLLTTDSLPDEKEPFEIISLGKPTPWGLLSILSFHTKSKKWLHTHPYDCIFSLDRTPFMTHYRAGNGSHFSFLTHKFDSKLKLFFSKLNPKNRIILSLERRLFENPKLQTLFTNSHMVKEELLKHYCLSEDKVKVSHNGIDLNHFTLNLIPPKKNSSPPLCFLFVGNDYKRKGLDLVLKALASLKRLHFTLLVVGKDKRQNRYEKKAIQLGLENKVIFKGAQKDMAHLYASSDCLLLPTHYDPFANVTLEALAMGLFVITSSNNGAKEIIKEGCGIILSSKQNQNELESVLKSLIQNKIPKKAREEIRASIEYLDLQKQTYDLVEHTLKYVKN